jgi:hypothetical protein
MNLRFEQVESELPASLLPCPECGDPPSFYRQATIKGVRVAVICNRCNKNWYPGVRGPSPNPEDWKPSLYEAVALWQMNAALLGVREEEGKDVPF